MPKYCRETRVYFAQAYKHKVRLSGVDLQQVGIFLIRHGDSPQPLKHPVIINDSGPHCGLGHSPCVTKNDDFSRVKNLLNILMTHTMIEQ